MSRLLDQRLADRLLSGTATPQELPSALGGVAALFDAARGPAVAAELQGEAATISGMAVAVRTGAEGVSVLPRRRRPLLRSRIVAAVVAGAAAAGTGLAAADELPAPAQRVAHSVLAHVGLHVPRSGSQTSDTPAVGTGQAPVTTAGHGPTLPSPALHGLCTAAAAGQGSTHGQRTDSTAFQALAAAAAAAHQSVNDYCAATAPTLPPAAPAPGQTAHPSTPPGQDHGQSGSAPGQTGATPPGASHGNGNGPGGGGNGNGNGPGGGGTDHGHDEVPPPASHHGGGGKVSSGT